MITYDRRARRSFYIDFAAAEMTEKMLLRRLALRMHCLFLRMHNKHNRTYELFQISCGNSILQFGLTSIHM